MADKKETEEQPQAQSSRPSYVRYVGRADVREIGDLVWNRENDFKIDKAKISADVLDLLKEDSNFEIG